MDEMQKLLDSCGVGSVEELIKLIGDLKSQASASAEETVMLQDKIMCAEKTSSFNVMMSEGKTVEAQRESFMKNDMIEFAKNAQAVKLTEVSTSVEGEVVEDAEAKILELAEAKVISNKVSLISAITMVLAENPELNKQYKKLGV